jgi:saccharopine dehydrogenase (NADP+, L-glutamate forming)
MENVQTMTHAGFLDSFLEAGEKRVEEKLVERFHLKPDGEEMRRISWSGFLSSEPVGLMQGTPAQIMEHILNKKWALHSADRDMIVMWHRFVYELEGNRKEIQSSLVAKGMNSVQTAMAKTVGLPMGIVARLLLEGKIKSRGVTIPIQREIYEPVLTELAGYGIEFQELES